MDKLRNSLRKNGSSIDDRTIVNTYIEGQLVVRTLVDYEKGFVLPDMAVAVALLKYTVICDYT
jgi:hypothetical protein